MSIEKLAQTIKKSKPRQDELTDMIIGKVISVNPLNIKIEGFSVALDADFLELSAMVKNYSVPVNVDGKTGTVQVFRSLETGDTVRMLRVENGQKFYVLERM